MTREVLIAIILAGVVSGCNKSGDDNMTHICEYEKSKYEKLDSKNNPDHQTDKAKKFREMCRTFIDWEE